MISASGLRRISGGLVALFASATMVLAQQAPAPPPSSQLGLSEAVIGELTPGSKLELARSTDNHIAWVEKKGGSFTVRLDGKQVGGVYDDVEHLKFSADEQHLAFTAKRSGKWVLVIDGQERSKLYGRLTAPVLSADGRSFMVSACDGKHCRLVVDGEQRTAEFEDISAPSRSADGEHYGYFGKRDKKWTLQLDGKATRPELDDVALWGVSPGGRRVAVAGLIDGRWAWVVDGTPGPGFEVVSDIAFSPGDEHYAYGGTRASTGLAKNKTRGAIVEDGKVIVEYEGGGFGEGVLGMLGGTTASLAAGVRTLTTGFDGVSSPQYAPDGKLLYAARRAKGDVVVVTGDTSGPSFEDVVSPIAVSREGQHIAYVAKRGDQFVEVRNHVAGVSLTGTGGRRVGLVGLLTMTPTGEHVAFEIVRCGGLATHFMPGSTHARCLRRLVVDGQAGPEYDAFDIDDVGWNEDGTVHCYRVAGADEQRDRVVFNDAATRAYDNVFGGSLKLIDDRTIQFVAQDGLRFVRVTAVRGEGRPET